MDPLWWWSILAKAFTKLTLKTCILLLVTFKIVLAFMVLLLFILHFFWDKKQQIGQTTPFSKREQRPKHMLMVNDSIFFFMRDFSG